MLNVRTLLYGLGFGLIDSISLPIIKAVHNGWNMKWMIVPFLLYAASPFVFLQGLAGETLTIMNLIWDLTSDVLITIIGLFVFKETISPTKMMGVLLSFISMFLMTYDIDGFDSFIAKNVLSPKK